MKLSIHTKQKGKVIATQQDVSSIIKQTFSHKEENDLLSSDANSKERSSESSSSTNSGRESISPPPLCPIYSIYSSNDNAIDHHTERDRTISSGEVDLTSRFHEPIQHQPWLNHIPKHYSLDYDFSDEWDLVIAGTTAATGLID